MNYLMKKEKKEKREGNKNEKLLITRLDKKKGDIFVFCCSVSGFELGFDHWETICPLG